MAQSRNEEAAAIIELMESRANVYRMLSRCYGREVDAGFAQELSEEFAFESPDDGLSQSLDALRSGVESLDDEGLEMLAVDFDRVFFGMGPLTARHAFPYESVYTSDRGILMQEAYAQVVRTYREQHLAKDSSFSEPEDHLAVEFSFMATLADRTAAFLREGHEEAAEETLTRQLSFAEEHLLNWIDRFCIDLAAAAPGFYGALADFTIGFVRADAAAIAEMLD